MFELVVTFFFSILPLLAYDYVTHTGARPRLIFISIALINKTNMCKINTNTISD